MHLQALMPRVGGQVARDAAPLTGGGGSEAMKRIICTASTKGGEVVKRWDISELSKQQREELGWKLVQRGYWVKIYEEETGEKT